MTTQSANAKSASDIFKDIRAEIDAGRKVDNNSPLAMNLYAALFKEHPRWIAKYVDGGSIRHDEIASLAITYFIEKKKDGSEPKPISDFEKFGQLYNYLWRKVARTKALDLSKSSRRWQQRIGRTAAPLESVADSRLSHNAPLELAADELFQPEEFGELNLRILGWRANGLPIRLICWLARLDPEYFPKLNGGKLLSDSTYDERINAKPVPESTMRSHRDTIRNQIEEHFRESPHAMGAAIECFVRRGHESAQELEELRKSVGKSPRVDRWKFTYSPASPALGLDAKLCDFAVSGVLKLRLPLHPSARQLAVSSSS